MHYNVIYILSSLRISLWTNHGCTHCHIVMCSGAFLEMMWSMCVVYPSQIFSVLHESKFDFLEYCSLELFRAKMSDMLWHRLTFLDSVLIVLLAWLDAELDLLNCRPLVTHKYAQPARNGKKCKALWRCVKICKTLQEISRDASSGAYGFETILSICICIYALSWEVNNQNKRD